MARHGMYIAGSADGGEIFLYPVPGTVEDPAHSFRSLVPLKLEYEPDERGAEREEITPPAEGPFGTVSSIGWGYGSGYGPRNLTAFCILLHYFEGDEAKARSYFQEFAWIVLAHMQQDKPLNIPTRRILKVISIIDRKREQEAQKRAAEAQ